MSRRILMTLLAVAALGPTEALALACQSQNTGNWSAPGTWTACGGGIPGAADTVTISGGDVVTLNIANAVAASVQLGGTTGGSGNGRINFNAGSALTVNGAVTFGSGTRTGTIVMTNGGTLSADSFVATNIGTWTPGTGTVALTANNTLPNNTEFDTFNNLTVTSGTTSASRDLAISGDLAIAAGAGWNGAGNDVDLNGDFTNNGTFTAGTGTFLFSGAALQSLTGTNGGTTTFTRLTLNNGSNLQLSGTHNITVSTLLTLTNGVLITNANTVYVSNGSAIASAGGNDFVQGNLKKPFSGANLSRTFEVGTGTTYSPVTVTFSSISAAGDITVSATAGSHPQLASSGLDTATPAKLNRWWTIANSGVAFADYSAAFTYVAGDIDAGANAAGFSAMRLASGTWNPTTLGAIPTTISLIVDGETGFGDFAIGNSLGGNPIAGSGGRFNAYDPAPLTPVGALDGHIRTKIAGTAFTLTLIHTNGTGTALANITSAIAVQLMDATDNTGAFANNCGPNWVQIQSVAANFTGGSSTTVNFTENDAWREVRVRVTGAGQTGCSNDRFAIRPADLLAGGSDLDRQTAGTARPLGNIAASGGNVHVAGTNAAPSRPFTLSATARASSGATTTNYNGAPTLVAGFPVCCSPSTSPSCPALPASCTTGALALGTISISAGVVSASAFYSEGGVFNFAVEDATFAAVDLVDTALSQRTIPAAIGQIGRFVPDHFTATGASRTNRVASACSPASSFTYLGEHLGLAFTLEARNTAEVVTQNYSGAVANLNPASASVYNVGARSGATNLTPRASASYPGSAPAWLNGVLAVPELDLVIARPTPDNPDGPFSSTSLGIAPVDTDSVAMGAFDLDVDNNAVNDHATIGLSADLRFGRLRLQNAIGSERLPLTVPVEAQYWSGTGFVTNADDSCTALQRSDIALDFNPPSNLAACETSVNAASIALSGGKGSIVLAAPGAGNTGSLLLTVNLNGAAGNYCNPGTLAAATDANRPYLLGRWNDAANPDANANTAYDDPPAARAAFGLYGGRPNTFIYQRENF